MATVTTGRAAVQAARADWRADRARYGRRAWLREQSLYAVALYRWARITDARGGAIARLADVVYWPVSRIVELATGISIPKSAPIGPGLRIFHFGGIFVHGDVTIGRHCTLRQGVTIGNRVADGPVPVLGDGVDVGAYAQILGGITIGDGAQIGAMSVVLRDVPPGATAVGVPARVVTR